jgi:hypothetical protein
MPKVLWIAFPALFALLLPLALLALEGRLPGRSLTEDVPNEYSELDYQFWEQSITEAITSVRGAGLSS